MIVLLQEELWGLYDTKIRKYIRSRVSDAFEAEDLFQEVGFRIIQSEAKIAGVENMESWLYRIATNVIYDFYRRKDSVTYLEDMETALSKLDPVSEETNYNRETAACLLEMAELLPDTYKDALIQSDFRGVPQNDLGEKWGLSYSGAKNRVQRARRKLKKTMLECCEVQTDHQGNIIELVKKDSQKEKYICRKCD
ncbi:sigma-70 family RNA polymerase sigma factor [Proteiniclasticum sp. C24MP]|uniref:sigma-70 family RNA polymerase sigma factor n=1 Tax=Proteiniclasticum sp. C24MP TaxID=3374101 RepID=UPI0037547419